MKVVQFTPLLLATIVAGSPLQGLTQQPLQLGLLETLKAAHIVPDIIDEFIPLLTLDVTYPKASAALGNAVKPKKLKDEPVVRLVDGRPELHGLHGASNATVQLTVILTDPDAPSLFHPKWSQVCHWIATGFHLTTADRMQPTNEDTVTDVVPYKAPGPPKKTGAHRYIFVALAPQNLTTEVLNLTTPAHRHRWGYDHAGQGVREWASENGLVVVGANFLYSQHKKQ